jgi:hypothetical protein
LTFDSSLPKYLWILVTIPYSIFKILIVEEKSHKMHIIVSICNNIIVVGTIDNLPHVGMFVIFKNFKTTESSSFVWIDLCELFCVKHELQL